MSGGGVRCFCSGWDGGDLVVWWGERCGGCCCCQLRGWILGLGLLVLACSTVFELAL